MLAFYVIYGNGLFCLALICRVSSYGLQPLVEIKGSFIWSVEFLMVVYNFIVMVVSSLIHCKYDVILTLTYSDRIVQPSDATKQLVSLVLSV